MCWRSWPRPVMLCVACLAEDGAPRDECAPGWVDTELGGNFNLPNAKRSKTATATAFPRLLEFLISPRCPTAFVWKHLYVVWSRKISDVQIGTGQCDRPTSQGLGIISQPIV
jgi:hypothetical protein